MIMAGTASNMPSKADSSPSCGVVEPRLFSIEISTARVFNSSPAANAK